MRRVMGGAFPRPEPEPVASVGLEASGTPKELLEQLLHIELRLDAVRPAVLASLVAV